jgi:hypothetical protein
VIKIAADNMLGRLAVWLRLLGLDTVYLAGGPKTPRPDRVLLTRRTDRPHQPRLSGWPRVVRLKEDRAADQLREAVSALGLTPADAAPLTRCSRCNAPLAPLDRNAAFGRVPEFVFENQSEFFACPTCGRVYWPGTHQDRILAVIQGLWPEK